MNTRAQDRGKHIGGAVHIEKAPPAPHQHQPSVAKFAAAAATTYYGQGWPASVICVYLPLTTSLKKSSVARCAQPLPCLHSSSTIDLSRSTSSSESRTCRAEKNENGPEREPQKQTKKKPPATTKHKREYVPSEEFETVLRSDYPTLFALIFGRPFPAEKLRQRIYASARPSVELDCGARTKQLMTKDDVWTNKRRVSTARVYCCPDLSKKLIHNTRPNDSSTRCPRHPDRKSMSPPDSVFFPPERFTARARAADGGKPTSSRACTDPRGL